MTCFNNKKRVKMVKNKSPHFQPMLGEINVFICDRELWFLKKKEFFIYTVGRQLLLFLGPCDNRQS